MKILHVCLSGAFTDGLTYQENLLTKYHKLAGHDVIMLTTEWCYDDKGKIVENNNHDYVNQDNVRVIRIPSKQTYNNKFKRYSDFYNYIVDINPEIIFIHNVQFVDIKVIVKYLKKNPNVKVFIDNHCDFSNSATNWLSKNILHKIIWRYFANLIEPFVTKFYGVLPARVDFLVNMYKLPKEKCELLVMGADDEYVEKYSDFDKCKKELNIKKNEFVIVTGGKIDKYKLQTLNLIKAVNELTELKIKLFIFGSVDSEIIDDFNKLCSINDNITYLGWVSAEESYKYFSIADLVCFPGRHSVYWEQVTAMGKPMLCKYWDGTTHVDIGGNVIFLYKDNVEEIKENIEKFIKDKDFYENMLKNSNKTEKDAFLYSSIAKRCIIDNN